MKNRTKISKKAELQKAKQQIIQQFPKDYETVILLLYKSLQQDQYKSIQNSFPKKNQNTNLNQTNSNQDLKIQLDRNCFEYLYKQQIPPFYGRYWTLSTSKKYYDMLPTPIPHQMAQDFWRWHQRRIFANFYTQNGCNILLFNQTLTDKRYIIDKARLKEVLFTLIKETLIKVQEYVSKHLKRQELVLYCTHINQISSKLISLQKYFQSASIRIWVNVVRMNYYLQAQPVTPSEIMQFQETIRNIVFANKQNKQKFTLEESSFNQDLVQHTQEKKQLQIDNLIAREFLNSKNYESCRQKCISLFRNNPQMIKITIDQIRKRIQRIISFSLKKMNYYMQMIGIPKKDRIKNHKELNFLTKSSYCLELHVDLVSFFVKPELMDSYTVTVFYQKLKSIRQLFKVKKQKNIQQFSEQEYKIRQFEQKISSFKNTKQHYQLQNGYFANAPINNHQLYLKSSY